MKFLGTKQLKKSVTIYIVVSMLILMVVSILATSIIQQNRQEKQEKEYSNNIHNGIEHVIKHYFKDYSFRVRRIVETSRVVEMIKNREREALYNFLYPKFKLMQEEEGYLKVMHVHLADGTSFLRVHQKEYFGDKISDDRDMLKEIHTSHKIIKGYETGKHASAYRIIYPIFDKNSTYIGAIELGLNPNFLLKAVHDINGFCGMVFIKKDSLKLYSKPSAIDIDNYKLQSELTPKLEKFCGYLKTPNKLENNIEMEIEGKKYITHLITLKDYKNQTKVKIIFFQDITEAGLFRSYYLIGIFSAILLIVTILSWFIYRRIGVYQDNIIHIYDEQNKKTEFNRNYLQSIFDITPHIMITTNGREIDKTNPAMLEFFGYKDTQSFKNEHGCICDFFIQKSGYLGAIVNNQSWLEYILENKNKLHKVAMLKDTKEHIFIVKAESLVIDEKNRSIVYFTDVTEVEELSSRLEIAVDGTNDGLWDWNLQTGDMYFSPQWKRMLGYEEDELKNELATWEYLVHPEDRAKVEEDYHANLEGKTDAYENIHRLKHKDGSWVWILDRGQTKFDENSKAVRMVGFHTDITKQKELEFKLQASQHQFEQFMEYIPAVILIKDNLLNITYANNSANRFFNKESIVGMRAQDLLPEHLAKEIECFEREILDLGIEEKIIETYNEKNEKVIFRTLGFKIKDTKKEKIGIVSINITKEYLAHHEVRKLKAAIDKSPVSIMMTDIDGNIEYVNPNYTKVSGYTFDELKGVNPRIVKSGYTSDAEYKKMWNHIKNGNIWSSDIKNIAKDGSEFWENSTMIPSFNEKNEVDGYIAFKLEITQKKKLEQELADKDELMIAQSRHAAMGEMISMIAHQWRQPISVIAMDANNMLADVELDMVDDSSLKEGAEDIIKQTQELSKTIDDFRNFFRPEKTVENILVQSIVKDALDVIGKSLENNNIEVILDFDDTPKIKTYSRELMQVFINIIKNAKEILMEKDINNKVIKISLNMLEDSLLISISDNAGGIETGIMEKIFDPYFSTKGEKNGTGLGLYMSKTIVEKHLQGKIGVKNQDNGACFEILLPLVVVSKTEL